MVRVSSTHSYYKYLEKYTPGFLRKYQSSNYYKLGRGSAFKTLVMKYSCDHLGTEEDHSVTHKTPIWMVNLSHRLAWAGSIYYFIYLSLFLGDQHLIFNSVDIEYDSQRKGENDLPFRYETIYFVDNAPRSQTI